MRTTLAAALVCLTAALGHAGDREDALAVVDRAIKAQGGEDALNKARTAVRAGEGIMFQGGKEVKFTDEMTWNLPNQWRDAVEIEKTLHFTMAVNGDKGWQAIGGTVSDLGPERLKELREEIYILGLETLTPLKKDGIDLTPLPEIKVDGQPAVGVKAASKGHADAKLYFDAHSHLLVKIERASDEAGVSLAKEYLFGGHKEFDGVVLPTRVVETLDGKKASELTSASYKFPSKPDESAFAKP